MFTTSSWARAGILTTAALLTIPVAGCHDSSGRRGGGGGAAAGGAQGLITVAGNTIEVTQQKSAIFRSKVTAPPNTVDVPESVLVKIRPELLLPAQLAPGFKALSRTVAITKDTPFNFLLPLTVTLPYDPAQLQAGDEPLPFYYEPLYGKYLPIAARSVDTTNKTVSFVTSHFTQFVVGGWVGLGATVPDVDTGFVPNADGFFHPNFGAYNNPGGNSIAMACFSSWYYTHKKATDTVGLYDKYRQGDPNLFQDDVVAKELISRVYVAGCQIWAALWNATDSTLGDAQAGMALIAAMQQTGMPQVAILRGTGTGGSPFATAVLIYKYDSVNSRFSVYDPNFQGEEAFVTWTQAGGFSNYTKEPAYPGPISKFCFDAASTVLSPAQFEGYYTAAEASYADPKHPAIQIVSPTIDAQGIALITDLINDVQITGNAAGGNPTPKFLCWYINGGLKHVLPLPTNGDFNILIPIADLPNPSNTMFLVATDNPRDEWRAFAGFRTFVLKKQGVNFFCNLGFETGDFSCWNHETHTWSNPTPGVVVPEHNQIVTAGTDPEANTITFPFTGTYAARAEDWGSGCFISSLSQSAVVPSVPNPQLQFYWSAVLEDPNHSPSIQPYVDIVVTDDTMATVLYSRHFYTNDPAYSGWLPFQGGSWKAIPWQVAFVDVSTAQGHTITIKVTAADCGACGHGGVVYLDGDE
ncbi:MAG: hypothetical protein ACKVS6_03160 [Planctomycetota bacterium]